MSIITGGRLIERMMLKKVSINNPLLNRYMDYAERQEKDKVLWYLKVVIAVPCVFMVISIFAMAMLTPNYIWFVGLSILLFFANVVAHIAESKSSFFVPLYHLTVGVSILIPLITYIISI